MEIQTVDKLGYGVLQIDVTNKCNLKCWFCRRDKSKKDTLSLEDMREIFLKANEFGFNILNISGGEPFLRQDILEILKIATGYFKEITITTNGTIPIPKEAFKYANVVQVSIDGDEQVHDVNRGVKGAYKKILRNIKANQLENIVVKTVYFGQAASSLIKLGKDIEGLVKYWSIRPIIKRGIVISRQQFYEILSVLSKKVRIKLTSEDPIYITYFKHKTKNLKNAVGGCIAGWGGLYINSEGDIYPCAYLPLKLGNLFIDGLNFEKIFQHPVMKSLRNRDKLQACRNCPLLNVCGGCRAIAFLNMSGNYLAKDPRCDYEYPL